MGIVNANKELSISRISCNDVFQVRLSLTAAPDIVNNPTDIVLVLDRSGSMAGSPLANLKNGAKAFIDIIDEATNGVKNGQIGNGSRIGIVSFASMATRDTELITSVHDLKAAVDGLSASGDTNHADAFAKASDLLSCHSNNAKVIVMFTDGKTTAGGNPSPIAAAARAAGATIYCVGLSGSNGVDPAALQDWASKPASSYVVITPNDAELEQLFADLARNISKPGATNINIVDKVNPCFRIISVAMPTKGTASLLDATSVQWRIDSLGTTQQEGASLEFLVQHVGNCSGSVEVNQSIAYSDAEGNSVSFPSPRLEVNCDVVMHPESCPTPVDLAVDGCEDSIEFDAGGVDMESLGRIVQLSVRLRNVCPNRRVALAVILHELDDQGVEHKRGMKTIAVPAHNRSTCRDVTVRCVNFVLPESLDACHSTGSLCNRRNFRARFIAHYIDHDYDCCPSND